MTQKIKNLISKKESDNLEFKSSLSESKKIIQTISAFANTTGGNIIIGISPNKKILDLQIGEATMENLANKIKENTDPKQFPEIKTKKIDNKKTIIIKVEESSSKPVFAFNIAYKRVGRTNQKISSEEIRKMARETEKIYWDEQICKEAKLDDIDKKKITWYLKQRENARNISRKIKIPTNKLLQNIKALKGARPTNAGILFFGKFPQKFFPNARLRLVRFKGTKITHPTLDTIDCEGTIWEMINMTEDFIRKNIRLLSERTEKSFRRETKFEYPIKALREAIINALIHRDYLETADVRVFIFDNRFEVISPGTFPNGISPKNPMHKPVNKTLCQLIYDIGFIEKYGSGIYMMRELSKKWDNKKPYYKLHPIETKIIFESQIKGSTFIEEDILEGLNERQKNALGYLEIKTNINRRLYCEINDVKKSVAHEELKSMIDKNLIKQIGKGRATFYILSGRLPDDYRTKNKKK